MSKAFVPEQGTVEQEECIRGWERRVADIVSIESHHLSPGIGRDPDHGVNGIISTRQPRPRILSSSLNFHHFSLLLLPSLFFQAAA